MEHTQDRRAERKLAGLAPAILLSALFAWIGAGCGSMEPNSASFASVKIKGHTPEEIAAVTTAVFREDGYSGGGSAFVGPMIFLKEGTRMNNLAYEGLVNTHEGAQTMVRVKTELVPLDVGLWRLQCQAYMVRGAGDPFREEDQRLANIRSGPYQRLLHKVAKELKKTAAE